MKSRKLVVFDCDGVVIDSEIISARMLIEELELYDVRLDLDYVATYFLGRSYSVVLTQIRKDFGVKLPDGFEADYRARLIAAFQKDLKVMPGIVDVLNNLAVPYCLATSSSPERVARSLEIVELSKHFNGNVTTASEVVRGKPAPDLFLLAAKKHRVEPEHCLVIEDSIAGAQAGVAAGMEVWQFTGGSHLTGLDLSRLPTVESHMRFSSFQSFFTLAPELKREAN